MSTYDLNEITLYDVIQNELGIPFSEANQKINCGPIPKKDLEYLQVDETVCILKAERIIKGQDQSIIEYEEAYYRSDLYYFEISQSRKFG